MKNLMKSPTKSPWIILGFVVTLLLLSIVLLYLSHYNLDQQDAFLFLFGIIEATLGIFCTINYVRILAKLIDYSLLSEEKEK